jgi:SH3-like domain-containing protein
MNCREIQWTFSSIGVPVEKTECLSNWIQLRDPHARGCREPGRRTKRNVVDSKAISVDKMPFVSRNIHKFRGKTQVKNHASAMFSEIRGAIGSPMTEN